jgi:hypothetical protein
MHRLTAPARAAQSQFDPKCRYRLAFGCVLILGVARVQRADGLRVEKLCGESGDRCVGPRRCEALLHAASRKTHHDLTGLIES